ncbi:ribbon-helix-helix domain-containing protein [Brachybacterium sp. Marseille-Q7125]|uniref:ribbon-helix-helix domain-containing protein n=1 Tax=Brachybacterium sp. Marseille-Q7125 TaxID=2932815 RepID=UPI001FF35395|nr:ribbon-helix-helix domain-containing protein [Brachybacterium sp. Marseille-Q7125]
MTSSYGPRARRVADTFQTPKPAAPEKKVNTSVWLTVDTRQALRICAATHGTTISALLEEGAQAVLAKYTEPGGSS